MDLVIETFVKIKDRTERDKAITQSEYYDGSNYELYNETLNLTKNVQWKNVNEIDKQAVFSKWIIHGKLSIDYKFDDFSKYMTEVREKVQKKFKSRFGKFITIKYILKKVDATEEKGSFLDIVKEKGMLDVENSSLKAQVNKLKEDKLELEERNSGLRQQIQELQRLLESKAEFYLSSENNLKEINQQINEKFEQSQRNYQSAQENFQNFKDFCRKEHKSDDKLLQQLTSSKEKLKKVNKKYAQTKSTQSRKRKLTGEESSVPQGTPSKHRRVANKSINKRPFLYIKETDENILRGELHTMKTKQDMTVIKVSPISYESLKSDMQSKRVSKASKALRALASGGNEHESNENFKQFFFKVLEKESELVIDFINDSRNNQFKFKKLSPEVTLILCRCLQWNGSKFKKTKRLLRSLGIDFLASYDSVEALKKEKLKDFKLETTQGLFWKDTKKVDIGIYYYSKVESLLNSVYKTLSEFKGQEELKLRLYRGKIIVVFTGDKGGSFDAKGLYMKWAYYVVTLDKPQDFSHFVVYAMMDAPDTADNMRSLHECYTKELEDLQTRKSPNGYYIHAVLSGDFMHNYNMLGLHGATAICPSIYSTIRKDHVAYHEENPDIPHNIHNAACVFPDRTMEDLYENYIEISANNPRNPRAGGKEQESVIGPTLFPLKSGGLYQQVMLPIIHIYTGLFGKLIIAFFLDIRELDANSELESQTVNTKEEIKIHEIEIEELYEKKIKIAEELIEVRDPINHLSSEEVYTIFPNGYECSAVQCKVNPEITAMWIDCSSPNHLANNTSEWMHAACEGMTDAQCEWYGDNDERAYVCNSCLETTQQSKLQSLLDKQNKLKIDLRETDNEIEKSKLTAEDKKKDLVEKIGDTEKEVRKEMDNQNAKSEKYWGNTYNGPNTMRFLESHRKILSHIKDITLREKWIEVFGTLQCISTSLMRKTPLDSKELEDFNNQIKKLSELWFSATGSVNIPTKFDTLVMHAGKIIANLDGITGAISEQSIERIHNITNQEARVVYNISNKGQKAEYLMKILELNRSALNSDEAKGTIAVPKTFTCKKCKAKITFKLQKCPTCNVEKRGLNRSLQKDFDAASNE